jgi:hypothetical protein
MDDFGTIVGHVQAQMRASERGDSLGDDHYMLSEVRCQEAQAVDPCVQRFVGGEMDPTRDLTVSRSFAAGSPPSLAEKLGSKLNGADRETRGALQDAVGRALAMGYLATCEPESQGSNVTIVSKRGSQDIWDFWAPSCRDTLEETGVPGSWARTVRQMGADSLVGDLKRCGFTRWLGGSKLNQLGMLYAQAGVLLRFAQTTVVPDEHFDRTIVSVRQDPERPWRFDLYPV